MEQQKKEHQIESNLAKRESMIMEKNRSVQEDMQIDLQKLIMVYLRKWWAIVLAAVLGAALALGYTLSFITPMYRASVTIYVNNSGLASGNSDGVSSTTLTTAQKLVKTYVNILSSDTVLGVVSNEIEAATGELYPVSLIRSQMTAEQVDETEMFKVYISNADPTMAAFIANVVAQEAPTQIEQFIEGSSTRIVDYAQVPTAPYTPNVSRNVMMGAMLGAVLVLAYLTLRFLLDVRVKEEDELEQLFGLPILGRVPSFHQESKQKGYHGAYEAPYQTKK
jgi:capsular polysaccharide biosynthesis protein